MRTVAFYETSDGKCPVKEYLDTLNVEDVEKILYSIDMIEELDNVPAKFFKYLESGIYEVRAERKGNIFRLLGFFSVGCFVILTNGFTKKEQKTPRKEIEIAKKRRSDYLRRKGDGK